MGCLIYPKIKVKDVVEALNPIYGIDGVGPCLLGQPIESSDGRYAHIHPWSELEMDWLSARIVCITGAITLDELPEDWKSLTET